MSESIGARKNTTTNYAVTYSRCPSCGSRLEAVTDGREPDFAKLLPVDMERIDAQQERLHQVIERLKLARAALMPIFQNADIGREPE